MERILSAGEVKIHTNHPKIRHGEMWETSSRDGQNDGKWKNLVPIPALGLSLYQMGKALGEIPDFGAGFMPKSGAGKSLIFWVGFISKFGVFGINPSWNSGDEERE